MLRSCFFHCHGVCPAAAITPLSLQGSPAVFCAVQQYCSANLFRHCNSAHYSVSKTAPYCASFFHSESNISWEANLCSQFSFKGFVKLVFNGRTETICSAHTKQKIFCCIRIENPNLFSIKPSSEHRNSLDVRSRKTQFHQADPSHFPPPFPFSFSFPRSHPHSFPVPLPRPLALSTSSLAPSFSSTSRRAP